MKDNIKNIVKELVNNGIKYAFGITGSGLSLSLIVELQRAGVRYFPVSHEAAGVFMAGACCQDGVSRAVAISIKGPGFVNLLPGILSNLYENRPAITVSEAYGTSVPQYRTHKRLNHELLSSAVTKGYGVIDNIDSINSLINISEVEPPGPVHFDLMGDGENSVVINYKNKTKQREISINENLFNKLINLVNNSEKPCLILGSLCSRIDINWNTLKIPVVTTAAAKGCYDETLAWSAGVITGEVSELSPEKNILNRADLIIAIGLRNTEIVKIEQYSAEMVMIDKIDQGLQDGFKSETIIVSNSLYNILKPLLNKLIDKSWGKKLIVDYRKLIKKELFLDKWLTTDAFYILQKYMPDNTILVLDTGFFCTVGETIWKSRSANLFCGSSVGRFMGSAIPTAIGVSLSSDNNPVLCVMGDGGMAPYFSEMTLAINENLPIVFILMTDGRYGSVAAFSSDNDQTRVAVNIGSNNWCDSVNGQDIKAIRVLDKIRLVEALNSWSQDSGPLFLELPFEPNSYANIAKKIR